MSGYDELHNKIANKIYELNVDADESGGIAAAILSEVFCTLETVTPEMVEAGVLVDPVVPSRLHFLAMLRTSPLAKPKEDAP